jgi:transposase
VDPPRRRADKVRGRGTYDKDRPPISSVVARNFGIVRFFVAHNADSAICLDVVRRTAPARASALYTDEHLGYEPVEDELSVCHGSVKHTRDGDRPREWARDDDGNGIREVHSNCGEGAGAGLRTFLRVFRGVHKRHLASHVAVYETMTNARRISARIIERICFGARQPRAA